VFYGDAVYIRNSSFYLQSSSVR